MSVTIGLSTASVYPESTAHGFAWAAELGYDAVEVMVGMDAASTDIATVVKLAEHHGLPVSAVHAPCLLVTQRVWGTEPWAKLRKSGEMAKAVGAEVVVVHPPFRWQKEYAARFVQGIAELEAETGLAFAVENMYPWRAPARRLSKQSKQSQQPSRRAKATMEMYLPGWDPSRDDYANTTIDLSHAAIAHDSVIDMADRMGKRLRHVHLTDGSGSAKDEHLVPGRGVMGAADFLGHLATGGFDGSIILEINTRRCDDRAERERDLVESLEFARRHFVAGP